MSLSGVLMRAADLNPEEARHTERVRALIADEIAAAGGWISFERFMDLALYAPGLGYYSAGSRKLGGDGDFSTAPEISPLFGACVARQCAEILGDLGSGSILEVGAGSGRLALDVLSRLEALDRLPRQYLILDVSADLRERQRRLLAERVPHLLPRLAWLDAPPRSLDGLIIANEVLDALPFTRFRCRDSACEELGVCVSSAGFAWSARPAAPELAERCAMLAAAAGGWEGCYESEYCARLRPWTRAIALGLQRGAVLWFDYGLPRAQYYLPERRHGTLICHFRHRTHEDPFIYPGLQDISAWVDFTALAEACMDAGCELAGFTTQAHFLAGLDIDLEMRLLAADREDEYLRLANQAKRLMLPGEMGERFKAMAWTRGIDRKLSGFLLQDLRYSL